jgi:predicted nucleic acid-binding protein
MAYLIDTCVLSELRKPKIHPGVATWMAGIQPDEIRRGIELRRAKDPVAARALERWLLGLESHYGDRILPVTPAIADRWGRLSPTQPLPVTDGLIAATALEHKFTVVTRNTADFVRAGVGLLDPFKIE